MSGASVSIVVPAYNEAGRIGVGLERLGEFLRGSLPGAEVIVVDDGSDDETCEVVRGCAGADRFPLRLIRLGANRGKGAALRAGVLAAGGGCVVTCDADFSVPVEEIPGMVERLGGGAADVAIGSREAEGTRIPVDQHPLRKGMGRAFNGMVRVMTGLRFRDTQCGFKGYTADAARAIYGRAAVDGFATDVEVLVIARRLGLRVIELPVTWVNSADSRVRLIGSPLAMMGELWRIRANDRAGVYGEVISRA